MPQLNAIVTIKRNMVFQTDSGKVWEVDKISGTITLYKNKANFDSGTSIGSIDLGEITQVVEAANAK